MGSPEEEKKKQTDRALKGLKGFTWFDSFAEIDQWTDKDVDPLKKSNTPLLRRPEIPESLKFAAASTVMLMHDYRDGWHEYEASQGAIIPSTESWYVQEQWQRIEAFNYFIHARLSVPPPAWINAGHRNGARVLGTFSIEGEDLDCDPMIEKRNGRFWVADKLTSIAACYGFDGYLINLELRTDGPKNVHFREDLWDNGKSLEQFLSQLKQGLGGLPSGGKLIWYDAYTKYNQLQYMNALHEKNVDFARAAGSIVTNYWWTLSKNVRPSMDVARAKNVDPSSVYFGSECWGQTDDGNPKRMTFGIDTNGGDGESGTFNPGRGHGGTATGLAVKQLAPHDFGVGLFASGWAYEHFPQGRDVDRFMWEGSPDLTNLPSAYAIERGINCKCRLGLKQHMRADFKINPIKNFAKQYPVGSESFFHTDYDQVFSHYGPGELKAHLSQQAVLPLPGDRSTVIAITPQSNLPVVIEAHIKGPPPRCAIGITCPALPDLDLGILREGTLTLHTLNARGNLNADLTITYQRITADPSLKIRLFATVGANPQYLDLSGATTKPETQTLAIRDTEDRVTAVGVNVQGTAQSLVNAVELVNIFSLTLKPTGLGYAKSEINNVRFERRGADITAHHRIVWSIPETNQHSEFLPWSPLTRPFSHFVIIIAGKGIGRAYALEFMVDEKLYSEWNAPGKSTVEIGITGFAFDGSIIGSFAGQVKLI